MNTKELRVPKPGEVWFNKNHWGACFIMQKGMVSIYQGNETRPSLLSFMGDIGNSSSGDSTPIMYEHDGWTVYDSYVEFVEQRRSKMIANLKDTIRIVNEVCDREVAKGSPLK